MHDEPRAGSPHQTDRWLEPRAASSVMVLGCALVALVFMGCMAASTAQRPPQTTARGAAAPAPPARVEHDFRVVAYQGEDLLGGREAAFSQVFAQGQPVVLNFWAGQCPPCRAEMPMFQQLSEEFTGRVIFLGVDVGIYTGLGTHVDVQELLRTLGIRYPAAYAVDEAPMRLYRVFSMPTTVFFDRDGRVVQTALGLLTEEQLRSVLNKLTTPVT